MEKRNPFAYIPFSAGARNCIGQKFALTEEKVVLCNVLRSYEVHSSVPFGDRRMRWLPEVIIRPPDGIAMTLKRRFKL